MTNHQRSVRLTASGVTLLVLAPSVLVGCQMVSLSPARLLHVFLKAVPRGRFFYRQNFPIRTILEP